jgi:hypothetical protein
MFASVTVFPVATLEVHSLTYIDNRAYPAGPLGCMYFIYADPIGNYVPNVMFCSNNWLAGGLLVSLVWVILPALSLLRYRV